MPKRTPFPALTVWQPWASLIAIGAKPYEFRGWHAPRALVGRRIAIHAAARPIRKREIADLIERVAAPDLAWTTCLEPRLAAPFLDRLWEALRDEPAGVEVAFAPLSAVVCTVVLGEPRDAGAIAAEYGGQMDDSVNDSDRDGHARWGWPMLEVERLDPPAPARGAQGFWTWEDARLG